MAVGRTLLLSGGSTSNLTSYSQTDLGSLSRAPAAGTRVRVHVAYGHNTASTNPVAPTSVVVAGVTLTQVGSQVIALATATNRIAVAVYEGTGSWSGTTLSVGFGYTASGCRVDVYEDTGSDAIAQSLGDGGGNLAGGAARTVTLGASVDANSRPSVALVGNTTLVTPYTAEAAWTKDSDDNHSTPSTNLVSWTNTSAWDGTATITNGSGTTIATGFIAYEIPATAVAGTKVLPAVIVGI